MADTAPIIPMSVVIMRDWKTCLAAKIITPAEILGWHRDKLIDFKELIQLLPDHPDAVRRYDVNNLMRKLWVRCETLPKDYSDETYVYRLRAIDDSELAQIVARWAKTFAGVCNQKQEPDVVQVTLNYFKPYLNKGAYLTEEEHERLERMLNVHYQKE